MHSAVPRRNDQRVIIHFDYDCFYAAVFEKEDPKLRYLPFAVQQKQIIVTCNYEARRRGLYKLQLVREAKKKCPDVIIALGEDLTRFRNASKDNYNFLRHHTWSHKAERLGFDEVFLDVTDIVDYNAALLNHHHLADSFFNLDRRDPTIGFSYNPSAICGHTYAATGTDRRLESIAPGRDDADDLGLRLSIGSHVARYLRHELEFQKGYASTVGISTNKLISKLVGNVNKPKGQTTMLPPYSPTLLGVSSINDFIDEHDIGKIPGIGFKTAQKIRNHVLGRPAQFFAGLVYGGTRESVTVKNVRQFDGMGPKLLLNVLDGPGVPRDLPEKVWGVINGVDDTDVGKAREVPQQISIEDSYIRLDETSELLKELIMLSTSLIQRMRLDLTTDLKGADEGLVDINSNVEDDNGQLDERISSRHWIAHPRSLRLSTRPRPPLNMDGTRSRNFTRISKSGPMPCFVFALTPSVESLARRLVEEALLPLFRKLHPEKRGWNLSLVNVCATSMAMTASNGATGRDISKMFRTQDTILKDRKFVDIDVPPEKIDFANGEIDDTALTEGLGREEDVFRASVEGSEDFLPQTQNGIYEEDGWDSEGVEQEFAASCDTCGAVMPAFAMMTHERFHDTPD